MDVAELTPATAPRLSPRAANTRELDEARVEYLGRSSPLTEQLRGLGALPEADRRERGAELNRRADGP